MKDWRDELLDDDSIYCVFLRSPSLFYKTSHIVFVGIGLIVLCIFSVALEVSRGLGHLSWTQIGALIYEVGSHGFNFGVWILGFMIAGFSIFATVTKTRFLITLAQMRYDEYDLSELKFLYFTFLNVFIHLLVFVALTWISSSVLQTNGILFPGGQIAEADHNVWFILLIYTTFVGIGLYSLVIFLKLKSFMWNLYQTVLITVVHPSIEDDDRDR